MARTQLIHCPSCGEDYAASYKRCPFCDAKAPKAKRRDYEEEPDYEPAWEEPADHKGGKRLAGGGGGDSGGRSGPPGFLKAAPYILAVLVILAALILFVTQILPVLVKKPAAQSTPAPTPVETPAPTSAPDPTPTPEPGPDDIPEASQEPVTSLSPLPGEGEDPLELTEEEIKGALKLSSVDFTLSPKYPTYQMEIDGVGRAKAQYVMANEEVATVSSTGYITALSNGNTTLTVTTEDGRAATAIVRVSGMTKAPAETPKPAESQKPPEAQKPADTPKPADSAPPASSGAPGEAPAGPKLSTVDFTLSQTWGYTATIKVTGGTALSWASSDEKVATVNDKGQVTGHEPGTAKITCTLEDGSTLSAIARVR